MRQQTARDGIVLALVGATLFFNFVLCFVNTKVATVGEAPVILAEAMIMAAAWGLLLLTRRPLDLGWVCFAFAIVCCAIWVTVLRQQVQPKTIRDLIIIPTFVLLGMQYGRRDLSQCLVALCAIVLVVGIFEAALTDLYVKYFDIIRYFIGKGATPEEQAGYNGTSLFVSGIRTDGRILGDFLGKQRVSSIFLEPISSAMFAAIVIFYALALSGGISRSRMLALMVMGAALLVMTDGRLAMGLCLAAVAAWAVLHRLPKLSLYLYLPSAVVLAFAVGQEHPQGDNIESRLGTTRELLGMMDLSVAIGLKEISSPNVVDSGISYLVSSIGLFGTLVVWCGLCGLVRYGDIFQRRFAHMTCLYLSLSWLVTSGTFTIKTAGLLWFLFGTLQVPLQSARDRYAARAEQRSALAFGTARAGRDAHAAGEPKGLWRAGGGSVRCTPPVRHE